MQIKNEQLKATYKEKLIKTSANIPQAQLQVEAGQMNSIYADTKIGLTQTFNFPTVYKKQKLLMQEEWKASKISIDSKAADIKQTVTELYYSILYYRQKELLCLRNDSI